MSTTFNNKNQFENAFHKLGLAFELLDNTAGAHAAHPHVLQAIDDAKDAAANLTVEAFQGLGYTPSEALSLTLKSEKETANVVEELRRYGGAH